MTTISFSIQGLEKLREELGSARVKKEIALAVGQGARYLHSALRHAVAITYNAPASLDSVLEDKTASTTKFGQGVIKGELRYKNTALMLSKFVTDVYKGNLPPAEGKKREGWIHVVSVRRPTHKISFGRYGYGGFSPRGAAGKTRYGSKGGAVMLERLTPERYPVKLMFGPSLAAMASSMWDTDPGVQKAKVEVEKIIENALGNL